jgi:hypothetical protein
MPIYTAWGANGKANTLVTGIERPSFADGTPTPCPDLIWTIKAASWEEAVRKYYRLQGWGPNGEPDQG